MSARFTDAAVDKLADYISANYTTYLRAVETELSLADGALPDPDAYVRASIPPDNRTRVDVYEETWDPTEDDGDDIHFRCNCRVVWTHLSDADQEAGELLARRCLTAMILCLRGSAPRYSLGGTVKAIYLLEGSSGAIAEERKTRHAFVQDVTVDLQETI